MRCTLVLLVALAACRKPPEPAAESAEVAATDAGDSEPDTGIVDLNWSTVSVASTGVLAEIRQAAEARHRCVVTASVGPAQRWKADGCLATRGQLRFASPDAMSLVVLDSTPDVSDDTAVGAVYRAGKRVATLSQSSLRLAPPAARIELGRLNWLGPGEPRIGDQGVTVQLLDGTPLLIRFDGAPGPQARAAAPMQAGRQP